MRKRFLLQLLLAVVVFATGWYVGQSKTATVYAQSQKQLTIPKSWGTVKGSLETRLIFEDSNGIIRLVNHFTGEASIVINRN